MNTSEFEVWLRYLVEELGSLSNTAHIMLSGSDTELRNKVVDLQRRVESLQRYYDFTLAELRAGSPSSETALRAGEASHFERGVSFIHAELRRGRDAAADSRRSSLDGQVDSAKVEHDTAVQAHSEAERLIDAARERGWDTDSLRTALDDLTLEIADLPPAKP